MLYGFDHSSSQVKAIFIPKRFEKELERRRLLAMSLQEINQNPDSITTPNPPNDDKTKDPNVSDLEQTRKTKSTDSNDVEMKTPIPTGSLKRRRILGSYYMDTPVERNSGEENTSSTSILEDLRNYENIYETHSQSPSAETDNLCDKTFHSENDEYDEFPDGSSDTDDETINLSSIEPEPNNDKDLHKQIHNEDTDEEEEDDKEFTTRRRKNKEVRHKHRNVDIIILHKEEGNAQFIMDFQQFKKSNMIAKDKKNNTTLTKAVNHLFIQDDSLLRYEVEKDPDFKLENLRQFKSSTFQNLKNPTDWINETSNGDGNKGLTRLKSHNLLRQFIEYLVDKYDASEDFSGTKQRVRDNLHGISQQISSTKLFKKYNILSNTFKQQKKRAEMILEPTKIVDIENIVKCWNQSHEKDQLDQDHEFVYRNAIAKNEISIKALTQYSLYARIVLLMRLDPLLTTPFNFSQKIMHYIKGVSQYIVYCSLATHLC